MFHPLKIHSRVKQLYKASRHYGSSFTLTLTRALRLHNRSLFSLEDMLLYGLLDPSIPEKQLDDYVSREARVRLESRLNDRSKAHLVDDKVEFHYACAKNNLPIPALFAVFEPRVSSQEAETTHRKRWLPLFAGIPRGEIVCKPAIGKSGVGIEMIRKTGERFLVRGRAVGADELYEHLVRHSVHGRLLLQKRMWNHPELGALSGKTALQTIRIVTFLQEDGTCELMFARLKLIVGDNQTDNFDKGIPGNIVGVVALESGRLSAVYAKVVGEVGVRRLTHHPDSGNPLEGFVVPDWTDVLSLVGRAAAAFAQLRVLAWDIAVTPEGPMLVEGNQQWGIYSLAPIRRPVGKEQWQQLLRPL